MLIAITRPISDSFADCQLTHLARQPIDLALARRQHAAYERALGLAGCEVHRLPVAPDLPDAVFVEDAAVVLDEIAIITRPGAESRRPEVAAVAAALASWRPIVEMAPPGTLDGGDVLRAGRRLFVGESGRTNASGFGQLRAIAEPLGYCVEHVPVTGCLHLKSAVTAVAADRVLVNPGWVSRYVFERRALAPEVVLEEQRRRGIDADRALAGLDVVEVDTREPHAANGLLVGDALIYPAGFTRTADRLRAHGVDLRLVEVSEIAKAEGAVTCCSVIVER